ncbi:YtxH domain-containing protein [Paenibacillus sp. chi10]|uniref:YtxH domain-containing protein n=1 Tax=Paenibacillus suaedae TaxID=3077233 RepID=A0AAJ2JVB1_9BACL|nr:YtxH domain-containing protein [Paenibacillus sp. chi10]MDT8975530.1 YtxH domain-containing protein [Paenibacillus sp. chi10]
MSNKKFWIGALIGSVIGSVSALLFAPKSGRELRKDIAEGAQQVSERTQEWARQVGEQTDELISSAKGKVASFKQGFSSWKQRNSEEAQIAAISSLSAEQTAEPTAEPTEEWNEEAEAEVNVQDGENKEEVQ